MQFSILCSCLLTISTVFFNVSPVSSYDCSPPQGRIQCECNFTAVECFGIQTNVSEIEDILANTSFASTVVFKIDNLQFQSNFKFENSSIKALTLGYDLPMPSSDFFLGLSSSLTTLNLQNNSIEDIDDQLNSLSSLTELFLDFNKITDLRANMFDALTNLKHASIAGNKINEIDSDVFRRVSFLHTLILSQNNFEQIENLKVRSISLKILKIDDCSIEGSLQKDTFSDLPSLEQLDLSHNKLSEIESHSLSTLKNLQILHLSHNVIKSLDDSAFSELRNLTSLDLGYNQIQIVKNTCFERLENLKYLDLSGNQLRAIMCELTTDLVSLEKIYLKGNQIKTFRSGAFFYSPNLEVLDVSDNNLECSCSLTKTAHFLTENATMKREDFEDVYCIIPKPLTSKRVLDFISSKCDDSEPPCKKIDYELLDDYEYDDVENSTSDTTPSLTDKQQQTEESTTYQTTESSLSNVAQTENSLTTFDVSESQLTTNNTTENESLPTTIEPETTTETESVSTTINTIETASLSTTTESISSTTNTPVAKSLPTTTTETEKLKPMFVTTELSTTQIFTEATSSPAVFQTESSTKSTTVSPTNTIHGLSETFTAKTTKSTTAKSESICSSLDLIINKSISASGLEISKNFSLEGDRFCVKWTLGNITGIKKCSIKYKLKNKEKRVKNLVCPKYDNEVMTWSPSEPTDLELTSNICIYIGDMKSCAPFTSKTITSVIVPSMTETTLAVIPSDTRGSKTEDFAIITLNVFFENSQSAYITWTVNKEEPFDVCNLTTSTPQYFNPNKGIFPCKNKTQKLQNVQENDMFKICIISHHQTSGTDKICSQSPSIAKASAKKDETMNGSLIPLICLLVLLVIVVAIIIFKNMFKNKKVSNQYNVREEEKKYQERVEVRPISSHDQSVRFSYIAKENQELI